MSKIIALSGWAKSGKDTAALHLIETKGFTRVAFADDLKNKASQEYGIPRSHFDDPEFKESPILSLPVTPKDNFTLNLAKMLYKEFRTAQGRRVPEYLIDASGAFLGLLPTKALFNGDMEPVQLYHTPRSLAILKGSTNRFVQSDYWVQQAIDKIENPWRWQDNKEVKLDKFTITDMRYSSELEQLRQAFGKDLVTVRINRFDTSPSDDASERDLDNAKFDITLENKGTLEEFLQKVDRL